MGDRATRTGSGALLAWLGAVSLGCYTGGTGPKDDPGADPQDSASGDDAAADDGSGGDDGGSADDGAPNVECLAQLAPRPLRRLDPIQYRNTMRDLFGDPDLDPAYADDAAVITELGVRQLRSGAEAVLARRDQWTETVFPCATDGAADAACVASFIDTFGARAFRRPLTETDRSWLAAVYEAAIDDEGLPFADAMDVLLAAMLQAPDVVYLIERGTPLPGGPDGIAALGDHEIAGRLSYLLWDTMPDAALRAAADAGELTTQAGLRAQVERMLASPRAEGKLQSFVSDWLQLEGGRLHFPLEETTKDPTLYPEYTPALQEAMRTELEASVHRVFFEEGEANLQRLFVDRDAYVNASLAALYGVAGPADDDTWAWVQLDPERRAGLVTRAAFLTVFAPARDPSPIRRGVYVIEELLCSDFGDPPPNVDNTPVDGSGGVDPDGNPLVRTIREETEARTQGVECSGCHSSINPTGFLFEHYDAMGRWQDQEVSTGLPVDASGELLLSDVAGTMADAVELSEALGQSNDVRHCFASRWVDLAFETTVQQLDDCTRAQVVDTFVQTGDMRELIVTIALSDAFRHVNTSEVQ